MNTTIVISDNIFREFEAALSNPLETAGVLLVSIVQCGNKDLRLLVREIHWVNESAYAVRESNRLSIGSHGYVDALRRAEELGVSAMWLHTHPGLDSDPTPSEHDRIVDDQISDLFRLRSGSAYYGTLILSPSSNGFNFSGLCELENQPPFSIDRIWVVGSRFRLINSFHSEQKGLSNAYDRNVRAFGAATQQTLSGLLVGIVGCGGTGSAIAEQLVRLGVRTLVLIDPDELSATNITRVYGSFPPDIGRPKVEVLSGHLKRIAPDILVECIQGMITIEPIARRLTACDLIFGCTDDNAGRLVLSRIAVYLLVPVIDCGVLISSANNGELSGIDGRITVLVPGQACLVCRDRIDLARASAELLTPEERVRRADEGYAPALGRIEPAVVTFTTAVAAIAITELLERLIGYGPEPRPSEILMRFHDREISTNLAFPRERHYCNPAVGKIAVGLTVPFLEQTWPN